MVFRPYRLINRLPILLIPILDAAFAVGLDRQIDQNLRVRGCFHVEVRLLAAAHTLEKIADVSLHHVGLLNRYLDFFLAEFVVGERMSAFLTFNPNHLWPDNDVRPCDAQTSHARP